MVLVLLVRDLHYRIRNPLVPAAQAEYVLPGQELEPPPVRAKITRWQVFRAMKIAAAVHLAFITIAICVLIFMDKEAFRFFVEMALPALLVTGGLLFGARRWILAAMWLVLLPVSGFVIVIVMRQIAAF